MEVVERVSRSRCDNGSSREGLTIRGVTMEVVERVSRSEV